jgi:hypothetical protein
MAPRIGHPLGNLEKSAKEWKAANPDAQIIAISLPVPVPVGTARAESIDELIWSLAPDSLYYLNEPKPPKTVIGRPGHDALWGWFGLSYASWLTLPRVMMHRMPDDWQRRMADLLSEWDATWDIGKLPSMEMTVTMKNSGRFAKTPDWLTSYRHPDISAIDALKQSPKSDG